MEQFQDKVAVITGAASGIGFGIAERCAQEGMKVVLAGINPDNLLQAEKALQPTGAPLLRVPTDVSQRSDIEALAQKTLQAFGAVHLLVNNAGVGAGTTVWESTWTDWEWVIGVNLWGVIYGLKVFVPIMLAQDTDCHIVNTSSIAGVLPYHPIASYHMTKHAIVALSENLHYSLAARNVKVNVSVLCPGWVQSRILESARNRPPEPENAQVPTSQEQEAILREMRDHVRMGLTPRQVADDVFKGIRDKQLYIFTHPEYTASIQQRMENILRASGGA